MTRLMTQCRRPSRRIGRILLGGEGGEPCRQAGRRGRGLRCSDGCGPDVGGCHGRSFCRFVPDRGRWAWILVSASCRCSRVAAAARSASPSAIARAMAPCSAALAASRASSSRARRRTRARCTRGARYRRGPKVGAVAEAVVPRAAFEFGDQRVSSRGAGGSSRLKGGLCRQPAKRRASFRRSAPRGWGGRMRAAPRGGAACSSRRAAGRKGRDGSFGVFDVADEQGFAGRAPFAKAGGDKPEAKAFAQRGCG